VKEIQDIIARKLSHGCLRIALAAGLALACSLYSLAQEESPLPGNPTGTATDNFQPAPSAGTTTNTAPIPGDSAPSSINISTGMPPMVKPQSSTLSLESSEAPVSLKLLQASVEDLKTSGASEESLNKYLIWLDTLIKAHNKLASAFAKQADTLAACNNEHQLSKQLYELKDQVLYLKAQLLMKENKLPEALSILVDITAVEPQSALGQQSYKELVDAGFSPVLPATVPSATVKINSAKNNFKKTHTKVKSHWHN
jgi:hypothetical protein